MIRITYLLSTLIALLFVLAACNTGQQLLENGHHETAVLHAVQYLKEGKNNKRNGKRILVIEKAYQKALTKELRAIELLKQEDNPSCAEKIYAHYSRIHTVQEAIRPHLPLYIPQEFRNAQIELIDIDKEMHQARMQSAEFNYNKGQQLLHKGKAEAREAYYLLDRARNYVADYKDASALMNKALQQGKSFVLVDHSLPNFAYLPPQFETEMRRLPVQQFNNQWLEFHSRALDGQKYDFKVVTNIESVFVGPDRESEKKRIVKKDIPDGFEYEYDEKGEKKKDENGDVIQTPRYKTIRATIVEVVQDKEVRLNGHFDLLDMHSGQLLKKQAFGEAVVFQHVSARFMGNKKALGPEDLKLVQQAPVPFPRTGDMLLDAQALLQQRSINQIPGLFSQVALAY